MSKEYQHYAEKNPTKQINLNQRLQRISTNKQTFHVVKRQIK